MIRAYQKYWTYYFNINKKTSRADYWWPTLVNGFFNVAAYVTVMELLDWMFSIIADTSKGSKAYLFVACLLVLVVFSFLVYRLFTIIPDLTMSFRRYHDAGLNPWFFMIEPIMLISGAVAFVSRSPFGDNTTFFWSAPIFVIMLLADFLIKILPSDTFGKD